MKFWDASLTARWGTPVECCSAFARLRRDEALLWAGGRPAGHELICVDDRLREAAGREGFTILP